MDGLTFNSVLCVGLVYIIVKWLNSIIPATDAWSHIKVPLALALGIGVVFLVGESDWAAQQEFMGANLETLNGWSKAIAGCLVGAGSVLADTTFKTVRNVGQNDTPS